MIFTISHIQFPNVQESSHACYVNMLQARMLVVYNVVWCRFCMQALLSTVAHDAHVQHADIRMQCQNK